MPKTDRLPDLLSLKIASYVYLLPFMILLNLTFQTFQNDAQREKTPLLGNTGTEKLGEGMCFQWWQWASENTERKNTVATVYSERVSVNHCVNTQELLPQSQEPFKQYQL